MNENELAALKQRIEQAQLNPNKKQRYSKSLITSILSFIESQSEHRSLGTWGHLLGVSGGTLSIWLRKYGQSKALSEPYEADVPAFIEVMPELEPEQSSERVLLHIGMGRVELELDQLAQLLRGSKMEAISCSK